MAQIKGIHSATKERVDLYTPDELLEAHPGLKSDFNLICYDIVHCIESWLGTAWPGDGEL